KPTATPWGLSLTACSNRKSRPWRFRGLDDLLRTAPRIKPGKWGLSAAMRDSSLGKVIKSSVRLIVAPVFIVLRAWLMLFGEKLGKKTIPLSQFNAEPYPSSVLEGKVLYFLILFSVQLTRAVVCFLPARPLAPQHLPLCRRYR